MSTSVEIDLFCGHCELRSDFLQIPTNTIPGMFVVVVSDAVTDTVVVVVDNDEEENTINKSTTTTVTEVGELCRLVRPVESFKDLVITVE